VAKLFNGRHRFVLSTSGHVQSILRPPNLANTEHYINPRLPSSADKWLAQAEKRPGTWWHDWSHWLSARSGRPRAAPEKIGNASFRPITDAPGVYVRERMDGE
jgi:polyhydroxyalkanoate synthase subunit PhaC